MRNRLLACLLLALTVPAAPAGAAPATPAPAAEGRLVVTFADGASRGERASAHREAGARVDGRIAPLDAEIVEVAPGDEAAARREYRADPAVVSVELDPLVRALQDCTRQTCRLPNDPRLTRQWGLQNDSRTEHRSTVFVPDSDIDAPFAWLRTSGSSATRIAILDTGVDLDHPDLASQIVLSANFTKSPTSDDLYGHGTHVAGVAAATGDNGEGVAGVALDASLMNVKVLDDNGVGTCATTAEGIVWAVDHGADVVGLSLGGPVGCSTQDAAIEYAVERGVLVTAGGRERRRADALLPRRPPRRRGRRRLRPLGSAGPLLQPRPVGGHRRPGGWHPLDPPQPPLEVRGPRLRLHERHVDGRTDGGGGRGAHLVVRARRERGRAHGRRRPPPARGLRRSDRRHRHGVAGRLNVCNAAAASRTACPSSH